VECDTDDNSVDGTEIFLTSCYALGFVGLGVAVELDFFPE